MVKTISDEVIKHLYELSKLKYQEKEAQEIKRELEDMLNYFAVLDELDTSSTKELEENRENEFPFREDFATNHKGQEAALVNAPVKEDHYIIVPKTIK